MCSSEASNHTNVSPQKEPSRLNPVSLRRFAYVAVSRASQDAMLFTDNAAQLGPQLAVETSKTAVLGAEQVTSIANAVGMSR
jgi:hypothetical protein